jgi:hypothetical protein
MPNEREAAVLLAIYEALLGAIPAHLRAITARWDETSIHFHAYEDRETMAVADTEVLAQFPESTP